MTFIVWKHQNIWFCSNWRKNVCALDEAHYLPKNYLEWKGKLFICQDYDFQTFSRRVLPPELWWQQPQPAALHGLTCQGADSCISLVVCGLQLGSAVLKLLIHSNATVLINKLSDLETTVSFYLSLGGFIFSVFGFSISSCPLNATCTVPWFFTEILLTWEAWGILGSSPFHV